MGIQQENFDKLFQKFESSTENKIINIKETGLGLNISKKLVE
jgi:signal transduction histidine kinase